jgi:hypothetical protein
MPTYTTAPGARAGTGELGPKHENAPDREERSEARRAGSIGKLNSTTLADLLLTRLEGVRPAGEGRWYARCPAHGDKSPSLSVRDTGEKVLLHCFAGCAADDVLAAVGLTWKDVYPDRWDCARLRPNEAAARYARRRLAAFDPMDVERMILRVAAADLEAGKVPSVEDAARVEVAWLRARAADGRDAA